MVLKQFFKTITRNGDIYTSHISAQWVESSRLSDAMLLDLLKGKSNSGTNSWRILGMYKDETTTPDTYSIYGADGLEIDEYVEHTRGDNEIINCTTKCRNSTNHDFTINKIVAYTVFFISNIPAYWIIELCEIPIEPMTLAPAEAIQIDYRLAMN